MMCSPAFKASGDQTATGAAELSIRAWVWAIGTRALDPHVDYSVGLVSLEAQGACHWVDRSYPCFCLAY